MNEFSHPSPSNEVVRSQGFPPASSSSDLRGVVDEKLNPEDFLLKVNLSAVLEKNHSKTLIQSIPAQVLLFSLSSLDDSEKAEVLAQVSTDQFTRILDITAWETPFAILPEKVFSWLDTLRLKGPFAVAHRIKSLEEEYQISMFERYVKAYNREEVDALSAADTEKIIRLGDSDVYYEILLENDNPLKVSIASALNDLALKDISHASSLLFHSGYSATHENEFLLAQFRRARMEEDGFLDIEEATQYFYTLKANERSQPSCSEKEASESKSLNSRENFEATTEFYCDYLIQKSMNEGHWDVDDSLNLQSRFLHLANAMVSVCGISPDNPRGVGFLLVAAKAIVSIALEEMSETSGESFALSALKNDSPKQLFRLGHTIVQEAKIKLLDTLSDFMRQSDWLKLKKSVQYCESATIDSIIDRSLLPALDHDIQLNEAIKVFLSRFSCSLKEHRAGKLDTTLIRNRKNLDETLNALMGLLSERTKSQ